MKNFALKKKKIIEIMKKSIFYMKNVEYLRAQYSFKF